ncbi:hypothetical protein BDA96_04G087800 [Sorghum bicolor]|uniref:KIB1-4 beta-propeller domain-containing protein n=2 Tax=Sorghum bicolor TaxID=4558 RepID=A0A921UHG0_SORBI|nr:hypothetical protein BDA96_04G087800 [Sorghum bicolor]OQU84579.1 hypothetical protein SORBI_3004G081701 [Sorghum bicolor]
MPPPRTEQATKPSDGRGGGRSQTPRVGFVFVVPSPHPGPPSGRVRWRDWAGLDEGPAGLIADRVLANDDVADYVRFRAVCVPWRRCCADPRARGVLDDPRLYPRQWIMLRDDYEQEQLATAAARHGIRRRFLNTRTGQCVQVDVPELRDHGVLRATADGLLFLHCKTSKAVRLLNPLTRQTAELPPSTAAAGFVECPPCCAGLVDHRTVYLYYYRRMAIARPGDDRWVLLDTGPQLMIRSTVFFAGQLYGVTAGGVLVTVDMAGGGGPRLVVAAEGPKPFTFSSMMMDTVHLVDNGDGDLRLVHRMLRQVRGCDDHYTYRRMYRVYRVNLSTGKTTLRDRRNLGGRAIFIDRYGWPGGLSVSPRVFPFLSADTIYLGKIGAYHVRDGSIEPSCQWFRLLAHSLSIADSLIAYVSG